MNVLQYVDGKPVYELSGTEMTAPVPIKSGGAVHKIYPTFALYKASEMKTLRGKLMPTFMNQDDNTIDVLPGDRDPAVHLFDRYFIRVYGLTSATKNADGKREFVRVDDPEHQKRLIDGNPEILDKAKMLGIVYGNIELNDSEESAVSGNGVGLLIEDLTSDTRTVESIVTLYDEKAEDERELLIVHTFQAESQEDFKKYRKSSGGTSIIAPKKGKWKTKTNYNEIERLYDSLILSLEGMKINGAECTADNKQEWVPLVPFVYKEFAVDQLFATAGIKNV